MSYKDYDELNNYDASIFEAEFRDELIAFATDFNLHYHGTFSYCDVVLNEIGRRIDQRKWYYRFFHKKMELCQTGQLALKIYWILKYKPVKISPNVLWDKDYDANVEFACSLLFAHSTEGEKVKQALDHLSYEQQREVMYEVEKKHLNSFLRAFSEHDIPKEALQLVAEKLKDLFEAEAKVQKFAYGLKVCQERVDDSA